MSDEVFQAIIETREIEFNRTVETRNLIYEHTATTRKMFYELLLTLHRKGVIDWEEVKAIYDIASDKEAEND